MLERLLTADRMSQRPAANRAHPNGARDLAAESVSLRSTLDLLADGVAAFAAAPDLPALGQAIARRLARAAVAEQATVWLVDSGDNARLTRAGAWPETADAPPTERLALTDAPYAAEAFARGVALFTFARAGSAAVGLSNGHDVPIWVVPLIAGPRRVGLAYLVAVRPAAADVLLSRVLALLGAQAAQAAVALAAPLAARREDAEFLAVAAHDLKNIATSIKGYTQLLRRHLPVDVAPRADRWTGIVEEQVGTLVGTLTALVDLGRLHGGRVALEREQVDLRQIVEAVAAELPRTDAPSLHLRLPPSAVPGTWDAGRLRRALAAALDGLRCSVAPEGGSLPIEVVEAGDIAQVWVGAPPADESWPREGEWAADADATLYLLRGVVECHGGTVGYRRTPDGAPLLRVTLPLRPAAS
ncbi:MAG TPA: hypothetical protein VK066_16200 [Chloroflexota bacterium]|nr:hypothetical protein [Chloroflexota bacterium]